MDVFGFFYTIIFVIGIFFGSFLNVIIDRLPFGRSIVYPPSHCPYCKHRLGFKDLVPIVSFFYLDGKCAYCKERISLYYPIVEILTGIVFSTSVYIVVGQNVDFFVSQLSILWNLLYLWIILSILIVVFFIDLKYGVIPFRVVFFGLIFLTLNYVTLFVTNDYLSILQYLLAGIVIFLLFLALFLFSKGRAIGFGDVFFSLFMGYLLGFPRVIIAVYLSFLTGAFISLILVLAKKKKMRGGTIPFGPFLVFGTCVSLFWGNAILDWILMYLSFN